MGHTYTKKLLLIWYSNLLGIQIFFLFFLPFFFLFFLSFLSPPFPSPPATPYSHFQNLKTLQRNGWRTNKCTDGKSQIVGMERTVHPNYSFPKCFWSMRQDTGLRNSDASLWAREEWLRNCDQRSENMRLLSVDSSQRRHFPLSLSAWTSGSVH